jgi:hypothetical protein
MKKQDQDQQLAKRFACSTRTVRRWRSKGVDLTDPLAIVDCIVAGRSATNAQLAACKSILESDQPKK